MRSTSSAGRTSPLDDHRAPLVPQLRSVDITTSLNGINGDGNWSASARSYRLRQRSVSDDKNTASSQSQPPLSSVSSLALSSLPSYSAGSSTISPSSSSLTSRPRIILVGSDSTQTLVPTGVVSSTTAPKFVSTSVYSLSKVGRRTPRTGADSPNNTAAAPAATTTFPSRRPSAPATVSTPAYLPSSAPISDPMRALRVASRMGMSYRVPLRVVAPKLNSQLLQQRGWGTEIDHFEDEADDDDDAEHDVLRDYNASEEAKETFKSSTHLSTSNYHSTPVPPTLSISVNQSIPNPNGTHSPSHAPHTPRSLANSSRPFSQPSFHPSPRPAGDSPGTHELQQETMQSRLGHRFNSTTAQITEERVPLVRPQSHIGIGASSLHQTSSQYHSERDYISALNEAQQSPQNSSSSTERQVAEESGFDYPQHTYDSNQPYSDEHSHANGVDPAPTEQNRATEASNNPADGDAESATDHATSIQALDYGSNATGGLAPPPRTPVTGRELSPHRIPPQPQLSLPPPKSPLVHHHSLRAANETSSVFNAHHPHVPSASSYHEFGPSTEEGILALDTRPDLPSFPLAMIDPACVPDASNSNNAANQRKLLKKKKISTASTANLSKLSRAQLDRQISQEVARWQANGPYHPLHVAPDSLSNVLHSNAAPFQFADPLVFNTTSISASNMTSDALARESIQFEYFHQHVMRLNALQKSDLTRVNTIKKSRSIFAMPRWNS